MAVGTVNFIGKKDLKFLDVEDVATFEYHQKLGLNDIALLELKDDLEFSETVKIL